MLGLYEKKFLELRFSSHVCALEEAAQKLR